MNIKNIGTLNYEKLVEHSLKNVVKDALSIVAAEGLPENHYFQITFATKHSGCHISDKLHTMYPEEMTIILQYEFSELTVNDEGFSVTLSFGNVPENIYVPFSAVRFFVDPPSNFGLQFEVEDTGLEIVDSAAQAEPEPQPAPPVTEAVSGDTAQVIDFKSFRKK